jgi:SIR2-like domain
MPNTLTDEEWGTLLEYIQIGHCAPFIGAGACYGILPLGAEIAGEWAVRERFPLRDSENLARVAQYLAVKRSPLIVKTRMVQRLKGRHPDYEEAEEPHRVLAELPISLYITTNYDDFMTRALERTNRRCIRDFCRWNDYLQRLHPNSEWSEPTETNPIVYHLHGHDEVPASLVLTEDDYLDFLVNLTQKEDLIPLCIQRTLADSCLLFLGYALTDWDFRVIFRWLQNYLGRNLAAKHVSVQLIPNANNLSPEEQERAQEYLNQYFGTMKISVYWGTCREFVSELKKRWAEFNRP